MKKIILLILALSLSLVACSGGTPSVESEAPSSGTENAASGMTPEQRADEFITVATGPTSGIYYPIGGAFATALLLIDSSVITDIAGILCFSSIILIQKFFIHKYKSNVIVS